MTMEKAKGFTLVELLIYIAILTMILVLAAGLALEIIQGSIKNEAKIEVEENARFSLGKINFSLKNAAKIIQPSDAGESSQELGLNSQYPAKTPTRFLVDNYQLMLKEGGSIFFPLTSDSVKVTSLRFTNLAGQGSPAIIQTELVIDGISFKTSASLRY